MVASARAKLETRKLVRDMKMMAITGELEKWCKEKDGEAAREKKVDTVGPEKKKRMVGHERVEKYLVLPT